MIDYDGEQYCDRVLCVNPESTLNTETELYT